MNSLGKFPLRVAMLRPEDGISSNAWKIWVSPAGDVYIMCRDNFREFKVSLHKSGRWRAGFTAEGRPKSLPPEADRAWQVWDAPDFNEHGYIRAFELHFLRDELGVRPEQRSTKRWKDVTFIEAAPRGKVASVSVFFTNVNAEIVHESEPSVVLASAKLASDRWVTVNAHGDPDDNATSAVTQLRAAIAARAKGPPNEEHYAYALGTGPGETRYVVPAFAFRDLAGR